MSKDQAMSTRLIHGDAHGMKPYGALQMPIFQTSTFEFESTAQGAARFAGQEEGYIYSRLGNPSRAVIEEKLAILENTEAAVAFGSGMGAISSATTTFLKKGSRLVADKALYGCTFALFSHKFTELGIDVEFIDFTDMKAARKALRKKTDMVYFETISNPTMKVVDIEKVAALAHEKNPDCLVVVDNTFATGLCCKPHDLGADIVVHSATKYLNGHGDVIAGFVCGSNELMLKVRTVGLKDITGSVLGPLDSFLLNRGLKTLPLRMAKHTENAMKVAKALEAMDGIEAVYYVGLKSHPQYKVAKKELMMTSGMIAFEPKTAKIAEKMMNNVKMCVLAVSLGDCETLIEHPGSMTHSTYTEEEMKEAGFTKKLVRLSVGLEDADDIIADLEQALKAAMKK
ncbi:MAG: aminotransferase class I/II-fold pyridoxal phosphate-dependent enzyme [Firmicutes bacterium]|nr:aminotransferase class I/II-fold pyridoxal phosphate-dependent enzyme [Bacillota bacterium]